MDPWQTYHIACHERNDKGDIEIPGRKTWHEDMEEVFRIQCRKQGMNNGEIDRKWAEMITRKADEIFGTHNRIAEE